MPGARPEIVDEIRRTFYHGALAMFNLLVGIEATAESGELSEIERERAAIDIGNELGDFAREEQSKQRPLKQYWREHR